MKEALLYEELSRQGVRCNICQRRCTIQESHRGECKTRLNEGGKLYSLIYGRAASLSINPIEKKPVFHFLPGSRWLSLGSLGCNFHCPGCQNWELSHSEINSGGRGTQSISPQESVSMAKEHGCVGISWTFNEPTIWFEYTLDGARLAKHEGLYTNYVTNGFITPEALDMIGPYLDVFRVDIKAFSQEAYQRIAGISDFTGILGITQRAKAKWDMHIEVVTNITPTFSDDEGQLRSIARWIKENLGEDTPWHVTRFHPYLKLSHLPPTPVSVLERARTIGMEEGLRYVYLGNVPGNPRENTYCPECSKLLIERHIFDILENNLISGKCSKCGTEIKGKFS